MVWSLKISLCKIIFNILKVTKINAKKCKFLLSKAIKMCQVRFENLIMNIYN